MYKPDILGASVFSQGHDGCSCPRLTPLDRLESDAVPSILLGIHSCLHGKPDTRDIALPPNAFPSVSLTEFRSLLGNDLISRYVPFLSKIPCLPLHLLNSSHFCLWQFSAAIHDRPDQTRAMLVGFLQGSDASPVLGTLESPRNIPESAILSSVRFALSHALLP